MDKFKQAFIICLTVFLGAFLTQLLANVTNIFATDLSTWLLILNSAVLSVITYIVAWLIPLNRTFGLGSK
jgi:antibiotic biosynthesis monooxygenase (ABM) superfamily enzyme